MSGGQWGTGGEQALPSALGRREVGANSSHVEVAACLALCRLGAGAAPLGLGS